MFGNVDGYKEGSLQLRFDVVFCINNKFEKVISYQ